MGKLRDRLAAKKQEARQAWLEDDSFSQVPEQPSRPTSRTQSPDGVGYEVSPGIKPPKVETISRAHQQQNSAPITVHITFKKPTMPQWTKKLWAKLAAKRLVLSVTLIALIVVGVGGQLTWRHFHPTGYVEGVSTSIAGIAVKPPPFKPIAPTNKRQLATVKDPSKATFDSQKKVFSFIDTIDSTPITVSQQQVPKKVRDDPDGLKNIAKSFNAQQSMTTRWDTAYIATNPKTQSQIVVFIAHDLLIFIQGGSAHTISIWQDYINKLGF